MNDEKNNPTPTLPFAGEGVDTASLQRPSNLNIPTKAPTHFKQGVISSPCEGGGWEGAKIFNAPQKTSLRRNLRKNPTEPERKLWNRIRNSQLGIKFRRQHGIGRYIVDFYSSEYALAIELDGDNHFTKSGIEYDIVRDDFINALGITLIRFTNSDVIHNCDGVLVSIQNHIEQLQKNYKGSF